MCTRHGEFQKVLGGSVYLSYFEIELPTIEKYKTRNITIILKIWNLRAINIIEIIFAESIRDTFNLIRF